jgi:hypothetical protein
MPGFLNDMPTEASDRSAGLTPVGALGRQVVVRTTARAGMRAVAALFRNMREPLRSDVLGSLALRRVRTGWIVSGGPDVDDFHGPWSHARWELRDRITSLLMNARPDLLWLHAAGVAHADHAVLITGPSGSGKSVLSARLIAHGFNHLGDDILPVDPCTRMAYPFPVMPSVRSGPARYLLTADARRLPKRDVDVRQPQVATRPLPIAMIVFPRFAPGPSLMQRVPPGRVAIDLLRQCRDFERHRDGAVRAMSALAATVPAWTLSFVDSERGADAIARVHAAQIGPISASENG